MTTKHHPRTARERERVAQERRPSGLPPDPPALGRRMTLDEKIDEASLESMDASDPPAYSSPATGSPRQRVSPKVEPSRNEKDKNPKPDDWNPPRRDDVN